MATRLTPVCWFLPGSIVTIAAAYFLAEVAFIPAARALCANASSCKTKQTWRTPVNMHCFHVARPLMRKMKGS